jgi:hypothetical protein
MENELTLFTAQQGNFLIRLLLAHIISDFVLQTTKMVQNKKWLSGSMLLHITVVFTSTLVLSGEFIPSLVIAITHWSIDTLKVALQAKYTNKQIELFIVDQVLHFLIIAAVWFSYFNIWDKLYSTITIPFTNYHFSLILLAYLWLIYPVGFLIKFATQSIVQNTVKTNSENETKVEHGGKLIGQFERIIILTLVLLKQYEAIGFLITGKSIIRFADHNSNLRSEYVLVGTMMSYAIAIITGVGVSYLTQSPH